MSETNRQEGNKLIWLIVVIAGAVAVVLLLGRVGQQPAKTLQELTQQTEAPTPEEFAAAAGEDYPLDQGAVITAISYDGETEAELKLQGFSYFSSEDAESVLARWRQFAGERGWVVVSQTDTTLVLSGEGQAITVTVVEETATGAEVEVVFETMGN